ncbi:SIMPL domain-containing protein [Luteimonas huabeiensis]|uniref:SIMPL domain-containing protein n=1 Tax=Luteimonas huabeiensis TaxID=1244513 RepID=UPI00046508D4|nr:SIMPL domain-containing protein [Luteimonas huabeiensis]
MTLRPLAAALAAAGLALGTFAAPMSANAQSPSPVQAAPVPADGTLLSVSAQAEASRVPDVATLSAGVVTQAADANAALRANAEQMTRLMRAVRAAGIAERDVQTSGLNVHPQYRHSDNEAPTITGYQASNTVSLKVRDVAKLGDVLDALVASGANQVNGPSFEIDQPEAVYDEARRKALDLAQKRAAMYAESLGLRVRRIVSISEGGGFVRPMPQMRMVAMAADAVASPVSPGESTLSASLDVVFELGR